MLAAALRRRRGAPDESKVRLPRHAELWLPGYLRSRLRRVLDRTPTKTVWLTIADHFEPFWRGADPKQARNRVRLWRERWPEIARRHSDSTGRPPVYTFFYPEEEYRPELLDALAELAAMRLADVEVHIHHDGEGEQNFLDRISGFLETLRLRHGLLRTRQGKTVFGFIHGNFALDNSMPDGRWCGLNNEITLLARLGCYADFTMPSAPWPSQARMVNVIYWVTDDPDRPKSYDRGLPVRPGVASGGDLLMIPGPLGLRWRDRWRPRLETGEIASYDPVTPYRVRRWLAIAPRVGGEVFLKLHTHGAQERNADLLLGGGLDRLFQLLAQECRGRGWQLRFVSAWGMREAVEQAAAAARWAEAEPGESRRFDSPEAASLT